MKVRYKKNDDCSIGKTCLANPNHNLALTIHSTYLTAVNTYNTGTKLPPTWGLQHARSIVPLVLQIAHTLAKGNSFGRWEFEIEENTQQIYITSIQSRAVAKAVR